MKSLNLTSGTNLSESGLSVSGARRITTTKSWTCPSFTSVCQFLNFWIQTWLNFVKSKIMIIFFLLNRRDATSSLYWANCQFSSVSCWSSPGSSALALSSLSLSSIVRSRYVIVYVRHPPLFPLPGFGSKILISFLSCIIRIHFQSMNWSPFRIWTWAFHRRVFCVPRCNKSVFAGEFGLNVSYLSLMLSKAISFSGSTYLCKWTVKASFEWRYAWTSPSANCEGRTNGFIPGFYFSDESRVMISFFFSQFFSFYLFDVVRYNLGRVFTFLSLAL